ncbi:LytS/YhcK type 5TM receptor domain-containing protein [Desulfurivibrio dismutans]|uniref:LytS/YhcK type 5TM receptor domain-containing protein n=1 Tax=Desulfurivibrio dismutans TaxID=1398908 RepID=UPI0023DB7E74|nr:LytS/YhcK type 5TM receptor domain-containing protein [Desulfurivibrio alkaliphilus]MDF1614932.1 LytS/YhcK type 5TM receptor domain-containing protein [Desulfurivibrio alkaliphilus]
MSLLLTELIFNLALLVALSVFSGFLDQRWPREHRLGPVLQGLLFGCAAIIGMLNPLVLEPGLIFDGRSVMVSLGALFYGPWAAVLAAAMTIGARVAMGGVGVAMGVLSVLIAAGVGLLAHYYLRPRRTVLTGKDLYLFGLVVHLGVLVGILLLPWESALKVIGEIALPILLFYPLATLLAGKILANQEALRLSEKNYRQLFDSHAAVKLLIDPDDGRIIDANLAAAHYYGWSQPELKLMRISQLNILSDEQIRSEMTKARRQQRYHFEFKHRLADGTVRDVAVLSSPTLVDGRALLHSIIFDITEQKKAEEEQERLTDQLFQARKMEAVGRLAGGVAHEFNNLMTAILANVHLAKNKQGKDSQAAEELAGIKAAGERAAELTRQLLAFARKQNIKLEELDLNGAVDAFLPLLLRLIDHGVELRWQPGSDLPQVRLDPDQLDQLLVTLVRNAKEAVGTKGVITIATATAELDQAFCDEHPGARPGRYIALTVRDDGCGMDQETLGKVFEPFFTTKEFGQGSGLGLATAYGIIKQNEGFIDVVSAPGRGTTVTVYLPVAG